MPKPTAVSTTNSDAGGDNPQVARENILDLMQKFNSLLTQLSNFMWDLLSSSDNSAARTALGASTVGSNVFTAADAAAARTALGGTPVGSSVFTAANAAAARNQLGAVGLSGDETVNGLKYMPQGVVLTGDNAWLGYATGAGTTVSQVTSNTNSVTINRPTGLIQVFSQSLAAGASVNFTVLNDRAGIGSPVLIAQPSTTFEVRSIASQSGAFVVRITNISGSAAPTAINMYFLILRASGS